MLSLVARMGWLDSAQPIPKYGWRLKPIDPLLLSEIIPKHTAMIWSHVVRLQALNLLMVSWGHSFAVELLGSLCHTGYQIVCTYQVTIVFLISWSFFFRLPYHYFYWVLIFRNIVFIILKIPFMEESGVGHHCGVIYYSWSIVEPGWSSHFFISG
jgi:hypothetical protein